MRNLTTTHRLQALSIPEITDAVDRLVMRYGREIKFQNRKLRPGPLINAIVLHFLALPESALESAIADSVRRLEAMLAGEPGVVGPKIAGDPVDTAPAAPDDDATKRGRRKVPVEIVPPESPPKPAKRRAAR